VFPSHAQLAAVAGIRHGLAVWLIRGCGLRIEEALAVQKSCFRVLQSRFSGAWLRCCSA